MDKIFTNICLSMSLNINNVQYLKDFNNYVMLNYQTVIIPNTEMMIVQANNEQMLSIKAECLKVKKELRNKTKVWSIRY